jgi:hypothetical protein
MPSGKLMLTRWTIILGLLGYYSALTASQNITISGFFPVLEPVSVAAADPTATTVVGTRTMGYDGVTTIPNLLTTVTETIVFGPSTVAYTGESPELTVTTTCVLTRSLFRGICLYINTVLVGAGISTWETNIETFLLESSEFNLPAPYTVTAGQDKLLIVTATTTSSAPSTSSATSASSPTLAIPPPTSNPASNSSEASTTNLVLTTASTSSPAIVTANRGATRHDTRYLGSAIVGLAAAVMVAALQRF